MFFKNLFSLLFPNRNNVSKAKKLLGPWYSYCRKIYFSKDGKLVGTCKNINDKEFLTFIDLDRCAKIMVDEQGEFQCAPSCGNRSFPVPGLFKKKDIYYVKDRCTQVCKEQENREWDHTYDLQNHTCGCGYTPVFPNWDSGCDSLL